jgi:hypothetical protein
LPLSFYDLGGLIGSKLLEYKSSWWKSLILSRGREQRYRTPAFEQFFYLAIKDHGLAPDRFDAEETACCRGRSSLTGKLKDEERPAISLPNVLRSMQKERPGRILVSSPINLGA